MTVQILARRLFAAACLLGAAAPAQAGLLPVSVTVTPEVGNFRWTYAVVLPTDMQLQSGNFFTIYDFAGYVPGSEMAPEGWTLSASNVGPTPERLNPQDDVAVPNLTFTYTGATIESGQVGLGNFMANSTFEGQAESFLTALTNRTSDGLVDRNITGTLVPTGLMPPTPPTDPVPPEVDPVPPTDPVPPPSVDPVPPSVPEPATLALAALGLPVAGLRRLVRRRS